MPTTAMKKRRLYRNMLRAVTFQENDMRLHRGFTRSSRMRLPAFGARGSMSDAGVSRSVEAAANHVAATVMPTPSPAESNAKPGSIGTGRGGTA